MPTSLPQFIRSNVSKSNSGSTRSLSDSTAETSLPAFISQFPAVTLIAIALTASGLVHLAWLWWTGAEWEGPLSLRKPGLFGISGGMTVWSIAWVLTRLKPTRFDRIFANSMAGSLFVEVGLITLQQWRGVASHFNRSTIFDASVELSMLFLISWFTIGICWLAIRSIRLPPMAVETRIALRGGIGLLLAACALGFLAHFLGEASIVAGKSPSIWGSAGILKYPHGAALHAIQMLPITAWLLNRRRIPHIRRQMMIILISQVLFLCHASWQTFHGRSRLDLDWIGGSFLLFSGMLLAVPGFAILTSCYSLIAQKRMP